MINTNLLVTCIIVVISLELRHISLEAGDVLPGHAVLCTDLKGVPRDIQLLNARVMIKISPAFKTNI